MPSVSLFRTTVLAGVLAAAILAGCEPSKDEKLAPGGPESPTAAGEPAAGEPVAPAEPDGPIPPFTPPPPITQPEVALPAGQPPAGPGGGSPGMGSGNPYRQGPETPSSENPSSGNPMRGALGTGGPGGLSTAPVGDPFARGAGASAAQATAPGVGLPNPPPAISPIPPATPPAGDSLPPVGSTSPENPPPQIARPPSAPLPAGQPSAALPLPAGSARPPDAQATASETTSEKTPFDPIKENGPIFVGWPKPKLAIVVTGRQDGYIEPCGCAGLDRMKGGLGRRHAMIESLRGQGWPVVCVDAGGLSKGYGLQTVIKFRYTVEGLRKMGYEAVGFGTNDLRLPAAELVSLAADSSPTDRSPFVSANVGLFGFDAKVTAQSRILERDGIKIGVTSVLGKSFQGEIRNQEIELADPAEAIARVLPELKQKCNLLILLAHATKQESIELGQRFPDFGLVVTSDGPSEPPQAPQRIEGTQSLLIEVGEKGSCAVVLGLYDDPKQPLRYQRVPLDSRFAASADMKRIMVAYQEELRGLGLSGLAVKPVAHPQFEPNGGFVGSAKCKDCHEVSWAVWKKSGHSHAWETLKKADPPRDADPECISCHVVGWHPTSHFPYKSGFLSESGTPHLIDVGCEACHGPGAAHTAAESGGDVALQERLRKAVAVTKEESQTNHAKWCQNCHDLDNSPEFKFETYWPKVEHKESPE